MTIEKAYKLVLKHGCSLHSTGWSTNNPSSVVYKPGKFVGRPRKEDGPLAVFEDLESLLDFCELTGCYYTYEVWECDIKPSKQKFLREVFYNGSLHKSIPWLPGTDYANTVKLTKIVEKFDTCNRTINDSIG